jgi:hypothetical protein
MSVIVVFVDAASGTPFGRTELPADRLPDALGPGQRLHLDDDEWEIVGARPATATEAVAAGELTLTLRRPVVMTSPGNILYSLPTIANLLPVTDPTAPSAGRLELHEDEWRQIEYVDRALRSMVERELAWVRRIHAEHRSGPGFTSLHLRDEPARPLDGYAVRALLPAGGRAYPGFGFREVPGLVADGFAVEFPGTIVYGTRDVLAMRERPDATLMPALTAMARAWDLMLVDWCRAEIVEPG